MAKGISAVVRRVLCVLCVLCVVGLFSAIGVYEGRGAAARSRKKQQETPKANKIAADSYLPGVLGTAFCMQKMVEDA